MRAFLSLAILVMLIVLCSVDVAFAQVGPTPPASPVTPSLNYGQDLYCMLHGILIGNLGTLLGLAVAFSGFVLFILNGGGKNVAIIIVGIAITAYPGLHTAFVKGMSLAVSGASATAAASSRTFTVSCP